MIFFIMFTVLFSGIVGGCSAGIDGQGAGIDGQDGGEKGYLVCTDGSDNDGDGLIDCKDPDCAEICENTSGDDGMSNGDDGSWKPCTQTKGEASTLSSGSVDIIWFIDSSGSMLQETAWVQQNLNDFATYISDQKLDYRVVLIGKENICVPPPLGGPDCTNSSRYLHIKERVGSLNGLLKVITLYPQYQSFLRADAAKNFVAVTDANSALSAADFHTQLSVLSNPGFKNGYVFHSIVAFGDIPIIGCLTGSIIGSVYLELTQNTQGIKYQICLTDWKSIFNSLAKGVIASTKLPCVYKIPDPGNNKKINPGMVKVVYSASGSSTTIPKVQNAAACQNQGGWYFDDPTKPTTITLCPKSCTSVSGAKIQIDFGCLIPIE